MPLSSFISNAAILYRSDLYLRKIKYAAVVINRTAINTQATISHVRVQALNVLAAVVGATAVEWSAAVDAIPDDVRIPALGVVVKYGVGERDVIVDGGAVEARVFVVSPVKGLFVVVIPL